MAEDDFETTELKEKLEETTEHALGGAEQPVRWVVYLSFTTAIIAVFAAIAALESGSYANEALLQKNEAVLAGSFRGVTDAPTVRPLVRRRNRWCKKQSLVFVFLQYNPPSCDISHSL